MVSRGESIHNKFRNLGTTRRNSILVNLYIYNMHEQGGKLSCFSNVETYFAKRPWLILTRYIKPEFEKDKTY